MAVMLYRLCRSKALIADIVNIYWAARSQQRQKEDKEKSEPNLLAENDFSAHFPVEDLFLGCEDAMVEMKEK